LLSLFLCQYLWQIFFWGNKGKYFTYIPGHNTFFWLEIWPATSIWNDQSGLITYMYQHFFYLISIENFHLVEKKTMKIWERKNRRILGINQKTISQLIFFHFLNEKFHLYFLFIN
jgi:hypothetical protein